MRRGLRKSLIIATTLAISPVIARAGAVVIDHSFGHTNTLAGPNFNVPQSAGLTRGGNLFQSLKTLRIAPGESVTFSGSPTVTNVLTRITGGSPASINGLLRCTIPKATFYLISPAGVVFGPSATLDVGGSFVVTTAQQVTLADGHALGNGTAEQVTLSSAAPAAFGFLGSPPAAVTLNGAMLQVPTRQSITIAAGALTLSHGAILRSPGGTIGVVSTRAPGTARIVSNDAPVVSAAFVGGGVSLSQQSRLSTTGPGGGRISINAADLNLASSELDASSLADADGRGIALNLTGTLRSSRGSIQADASGGGAGGPIQITAKHIRASGAGAVGLNGITTTSSGDGAAGGISIDARTLSLTAGARISSESFAAAGGGNIRINVDQLALDGRGSRDLTVIASNSTSPEEAKAGSIFIKADAMSVVSGAKVSATSNDFEPGGDLTVVAHELKIDGRGASLSVLGFTGLFAGTGEYGGDGGTVRVHAGNITLNGGGKIENDTLGSGDAGPTSVTANRLNIVGVNQQFSSAIASGAQDGSYGLGGALAVRARSVELAGGGQIITQTSGSGDAGNLTLGATNVVLDGSGTSLGTGIISDAGAGRGNAGTIHVQANKLSVHHAALITSSTESSGNAGNVYVQARHAQLASSQNDTGNSVISSSANQGSTGDAGVIHVATHNLQLTSGGLITTDTDAFGQAGAIDVTTSRLSIDGRSTNFLTGISSTARQNSDGQGGTIDVKAISARIIAGGKISSDTLSVGDAGDVHLRAKHLLIDGRINNEQTAVETRALAGSTGNAGAVTVRSDSLDIDAKGIISSSSSGQGKGGNVVVSARNITLDGVHPGYLEATGITANSSFSSQGSAGDIDVVATQRLRLLGDSEISTQASLTGGGNEMIHARDLQLKSGELITNADLAGGNIAIDATSTLAIDANGRIHANSGGTAKGDNGGNILIGRTNLALLPGVTTNAISANANQGNGGNITIAPGLFLRSPGTPTDAINSSSIGGIAGTISIQSPEVDLTSEINPLNATLGAAGISLAPTCGMNTGAGQSSFTLEGGNGLPPDPSQTSQAAPSRE